MLSSWLRYLTQRLQNLDANFLMPFKSLCSAWHDTIQLFIQNHSPQNHSLLVFSAVGSVENLKEPEQDQALKPAVDNRVTIPPTIWVYIYIPNLLIQLRISPHADYLNYSTGSGLFMSCTLITEVEINSLSGFSTQLQSTISLNDAQIYRYCNEKEKLNMGSYWLSG